MRPCSARSLPARLALAALALGSLAGSPASAGSPGDDVRPELGPGTEPIETCLRHNLPKKSSVQTVRFETTDRMGHSRVLAGKLYRKCGANDRGSSLMRSGVRVASAFTLRDLHEQTETRLSLGAIEVDARRRSPTRGWCASTPTTSSGCGAAIRARRRSSTAT